MLEGGIIAYDTNVRSGGEGRATWASTSRVSTGWTR
jgi:curli biogenesis system outer membrane secretion channel CsgG